MSQARTGLRFSESNSAEVFAERLAQAPDAALPQVLSAVVTHLHALIRDLRPSQADWRAVIHFLTEVGHACDERRQEWVLLSDLLGASALVEEVNGRRPKGATPNTVRGPFYRADAPALPNGATISLDGIGVPLHVSGKVVDLDGKPVAGASIVTWQANAEGFYENQQPDLQPEFNLRGRFTTGADGGFAWQTVRPAGYGVPDDGPVGALMKAAGYPLRRPAHLHFVVSAKGFETVTTHLYDGDDPHLAEDAIFGVKPELIRSFQPATMADGRAGFAVEFTFVLVRARAGQPGGAA